MAFWICDKTTKRSLFLHYFIELIDAQTAFFNEVKRNPSLKGKIGIYNYDKSKLVFE